MGTNFYCVTKDHACNCPRWGERHHIGKSSAGWVFAVAENQELQLHSWEEWKCFFGMGQFEHIEDEYGTKVSIAEMIDRVEKRAWPTHADKSLEELAAWIESDYGRPLEFGLKTENQASKESNWKHYRGPLPLPGPNGLLRHPLDGYCVAHGKGTWDVMRGKFS